MSASTPAPWSSSLSRVLWIPPALFLISASLTKSSSPLLFLDQLSDYSLSLPLNLQAVLSLFLPGLEMLLGTLLLFRRLSWAAIGAVVLLLIFTIAIIMGLPAGYLHRCGCLGPENLDPALSIAKNVLLILLLIGGFLRSGRTILGDNPWGAFAVVAGGTWSGGIALPIIFTVGALLAFNSGKKHLLSFCLSLLLGLGLHFFEFPFIVLPILGTVIYLWGLQPLRLSLLDPSVMTAAILLTTAACFIWPPAPAVIPSLLQAGSIWPDGLPSTQRFPQDADHRSLVIFLQTDCDECRAWLPAAISLSRRTSLPPIVGLAPGSEMLIQNYVQKEAIPFPIMPVDKDLFDRAASRTPLLVYVRSDTVRVISAPGSLPPIINLEELISNERH